jgi:multimeric flavodoxin WrbA
MKALAINGSPRKGGNVEILLRRALEPIFAAGHETEIVQIGGVRLRGCIACGDCGRNLNKRCSLEDDGFNDVFAKMLEADAILIGTPAYFADMTADTKALIERAGYVALANGGLLRRKIGAAVVAARRGGFVPVLDSINHLFLMTEMIVPGSTYWNYGQGLSPGDVLNDEEGMENMKNLGEQIVWLMERLGN